MEKLLNLKGQVGQNGIERLPAGGRKLHACREGKEIGPNTRELTQGRLIPIMFGF